MTLQAPAGDEQIPGLEVPVEEVVGAGGQGPGEETFEIRRQVFQADLQAEIVVQKGPDEITALPLPQEGPVQHRGVETPGGVEPLLPLDLHVHQDFQGLAVPMANLALLGLPLDGGLEADVPQVLDHHPELFPAIGVDLRHRHPLRPEVAAHQVVGVVFIHFPSRRERMEQENDGGGPQQAVVAAVGAVAGQSLGGGEADVPGCRGGLQACGPEIFRHKYPPGPYGAFYLGATFTLLL